MRKFEEGKTYLAKLSGEVRGEVKIIKRTAKRATIEYWGSQKTIAIKEKKDKDGYMSEYLFIMWEGVFASDVA